MDQLGPPRDVFGSGSDLVPAGLAFRLGNMEEGKEADLTGRLGSRVQVKGVLNGRGDAARILCCRCSRWRVRARR